MSTLVADVRAWLDRLSRLDGKTADCQEDVHDALREYVEQQDKAQLMAAISPAIGRSKKRRRQAVFLYAELTDQSEALEALRYLFGEADDDLTIDLLETIQFYGISSLAECVTGVLTSDRPNHVKSRAIGAAVALRSNSALPVLLEMASENDTPFVLDLAIAFTQYAKPECHEFLSRVYNSFPDTITLRIWAAWGLCKLGAEEPFEYLVNCISGRVPTSSHADPIRAAQAICELRGLPFRWSAKAPEKTLERLRKG